jgi:hypothetical protein
MKKLKNFNLVMGILHLIQGLAMVIVSLNVEKVANFKPTIYSYFLKFDSTSMKLVTDVKELFELPFALCVSVFLLLSALFHFIIVYCNKKYIKDLEKGINKFRWYEYALSSSLMITLIAVLFGVYDIGALILIFGLNASMNLFGLLMEKINQYTTKTNWSAFVYGSIAGIIPWIVITMYAFGNSDPAQVPWFVYAVFISYFIFFNLFPINMILQYKKLGKWKDYIYGERVYIILSLVAKTILAWLVFFGIMQPV